MIEQNQMPAETLLWKALKDIDFRFALSSNGQLVIIKDPEQHRSQAVTTGAVSGQVLEASTNESLPGAGACIKGSKKGVSTDAGGQFSIDE